MEIKAPKDYKNEIDKAERFFKQIDKGLTEFGKQNGFPVIFVITNKNYNPPKHDEFKGVYITDESEVTCFKKNEMKKAAEFAQSVNGELGVFDPKQKEHLK